MYKICLYNIFREVYVKNHENGGYGSFLKHCGVNSRM